MPYTLRIDDIDVPIVDIKQRFADGGFMVSFSLTHESDIATLIETCAGRFGSFIIDLHEGEQIVGEGKLKHLTRRQFEFVQCSSHLGFAGRRNEVFDV